MLQIAVEMLMGDRVKYTILICALAFSTLLITQQMGVFIGLLNRTISILHNTHAKIWFFHPDVEQVEFPFSFKDTYLDIVRSLPGVKAAWPLLYREVTLKSIGGTSLTGDLMGVDSQTLTGLPPHVAKGSVADLWNENSIALDTLGANLLSKGLPKPLDIGDVILVNDHELKLVALFDAYPPFTSTPRAYLPYSRALEILPKTRTNTAYIIVEPREGFDPKRLIQEIQKYTPLKAYTSDQMGWKTIGWVANNTGVVLSFGTTIVLGFIVGVVVAGQTFYSFVYENSTNLAALKAMGISDSLMKKMIFTQVFIAGFIGYGIGLLFTAIFGFSTFYFPLIPFYINSITLFITFIAMIMICLFSAYLGILKINTLSPAEVFRG